MLTTYQREGAMSDHRHGDINSSSIPVAGIGGAGMIGAAIVIALTFPQAMFLVVGGIVFGGLLATVLIVRRRARDTSRPGGDSPFILFRATRADAESAPEQPHRPSDPMLDRRLVPVQ
jgi:hypothetical protein